MNEVRIIVTGAGVALGLATRLLAESAGIKVLVVPEPSEPTEKSRLESLILANVQDLPFGDEFDEPTVGVSLIGQHGPIPNLSGAYQHKPTRVRKGDSPAKRLAERLRERRLKRSP